MSMAMCFHILVSINQSIRPSTHTHSSIVPLLQPICLAVAVAVAVAVDVAVDVDVDVAVLSLLVAPLSILLTPPLIV